MRIVAQIQTMYELRQNQPETALFVQPETNSLFSYLIILKRLFNSGY